MKQYMLILAVLFVASTSQAVDIGDRNTKKIASLLSDQRTMAQIKMALKPALPGEFMDLMGIEWVGTAGGAQKIEDSYRLHFNNFMHTDFIPLKACVVTVVVTEIPANGPSTSKFTVQCK